MPHNCVPLGSLKPLGTDFFFCHIPALPSEVADGTSDRQARRRSERRDAGCLRPVCVDGGASASSSRGPPAPARPPASDEDCAVVGGRGLCRGHGSGGTDGMEGPARRHPGETRRSGTSRARRGCGFVKKCDLDFSAGNSERREPLLGSLVPATFSFLFTLSMERGKISLSGELLALGRK